MPGVWVVLLPPPPPSRTLPPPPLLSFFLERKVTEVSRLYIIALIAAILVAVVDVAAVDATALAASSVRSVIVVWPSRDAYSSRMWPSCWVDLSSSAAAYSIAAV